MPIVGAGLAKPPAIERNGQLTFTGYLVNVLILITCIGTLIYPQLSRYGAIHFDCIFKQITGLPCPSCGYSAAIESVFQHHLSQSFLHNPGWLIWIAFQLLLIFIGIKSLVNGRQTIIGRRLLPVLIILILLIWTAKFIIGPEYY